MSLPKPYYEHGGITIYHGDCLEIMPLLPEAGFGAIYSDPPFTAAGGATNGRVLDADDQFFSHWFADVVREMRRLSAPTSAWFLHCDWRTVGAFQRAIVKASRNTRTQAFRLQQVLYWNRGHMGMGTPFRNCMEMIAFVRGPRWSQESSGMPRNVLTHLDFPWPYTGRVSGHGAEKPVALIAHLIGLTVPRDETILDPFVGSGSTLLAARSLGYRAIGIEIEEKYCEIAAKRLAQEVLPFGGESC